MSNPIEIIKQKLEQIQKQLDEINNLIKIFEMKPCFLCGGKDHISKDCIDTQPETEDDRDVYEDDSEDDDDEFYKRIYCNRCGRIGHYSVQCYSKTHINGDDLDDYTDAYHSE